MRFSPQIRRVSIDHFPFSNDVFQIMAKHKPPQGSDKPKHVLYWWPTFTDLIACKLADSEVADVPRQPIPFLELLHSTAPSPELIIVFREVDLEALWSEAERYFQQAYPNTWPSPELFLVVQVPPMAENLPYFERTNYLKEKLSLYTERYPKAQHAFLWSTGDPVLEVVVLLLQNDVFPDMELLRVEETRAGRTVVRRHMESQIPFTLMARMKTEKVESAAQELLQGVIAESPSMRAAVEKARLYAIHRKPVLILGETGTGKEIIAQIIHRASGVTGRFLALNCGAIPQELLETELFGSVRGVATDSVDRPGLFELADGGTIFLDEFGELRLDHQIKILRVLQERKVRRVGGERETPVDFLLITATNRDLEALIEEGEFRRDLYWRINVGRIQLSPLRERPEDVLALAERLSALQNPSKKLTPSAREWLVHQPWPGNFRQIQNLFDRIEIERAQATEIDVAELIALQDRPSIVADEDGDEADYKTRKRLGEKNQLIMALEASRGNLGLTAQQLGTTYNTLYKRCRALGIDVQTLKKS